MKSTFLILFTCSFGITLFAQNADSSNFYYQKGLDEFNQRRYLVSTTYFTKAISFNNTNVDAFMKCGEAYNEMRKLDKAMEAYSKVLALQPNNEKAIEALSNLHFCFKQFDKAIELANKCSTCANKEKLLGTSYYSKEDYPLAEKYFLSYLAKNAGDAEANYLLAQTYMQMEYDKKALPFMEAAIKLDDSKGNRWFEYGVVLFNSQQYGMAANAFNKAVEKGYPKSLELAEQLGYSYLFSGQFDKGEEFIMYVFTRKPGSVDLLQDVAEILYKKQQYDRSLAYCQKMIEANPNNGKALYQAGLNFIKKGDRTKGETLCDKGIELDPSLAKLKKEVKMEF